MHAPPADIFVWGMHPDTTDEDIVNDLAASDIKIEVKDVEKKSKEEAPFNSYRIRVPAPDLQKALDPSIWPLRVKVREYIYYPKKKDSQSQSQTNQINSHNSSSNPQHAVHQQMMMNVQPPVVVSNRYDALSSDNVAAVLPQ